MQLQVEWVGCVLHCALHGVDGAPWAKHSKQRLPPPQPVLDSVCRILAKMEDADGLRNLDKVLDASDGVIIARGSIGLELSPEKVALAQNLCTTKCNIRGKVRPTAELSVLVCVLICSVLEFPFLMDKQSVCKLGVDNNSKAGLCPVLTCQDPSGSRGGSALARLPLDVSEMGRLGIV